MPHTYSDYAERQRRIKARRKQIAELDKLIASQATVLTDPEPAPTPPEPTTPTPTRDDLAKRIPALDYKGGMA